jgi:hypothetical protein
MLFMEARLAVADALALQEKKSYRTASVDW